MLWDKGQVALQYSTTQGYFPLREYIARRYWEKKGIKIDPDEVLITNGSQQGFDLVGRLFINRGDGIIMEAPAYHGAIGAFSLYEPTFHSVPMREDGIDPDLLEESCRMPGVKLLYTVPNFQNPSGLTYSDARRREVGAILARHGVLLVEDDPYGELRFRGEHLPSMRSYLDSTIMLGTFSKTVAPGFRIGWMCAGREVIDQLTLAKQSVDIHSSAIDQRILYQYLTHNDVDAHIALLTEGYRKQREQMIASLAEFCPPEIHYTHPDGGMFLWVTLPKGLSALGMFDMAVKEKVAYVPGQAFHVGGIGGDDSMRLSYSTFDMETIHEGCRRLGRVMERSMDLARR
ncbi:MAG TPA: PLP-dependent aminotransferase family protein [Chloroflexota bacterium]|nr:PLP-dependent aminotransferase family protein [Chloroflexota bacterium]